MTNEKIEIMENLKLYINNSDNTIIKLIENEFKQEVIDEFKCEKCNFGLKKEYWKSNKATLSIEINKYPNILYIQIGRFQRNNDKTIKLNNNITFNENINHCN